MSTVKILAAAALTAATVSLAFAQGTPPRPATDPAVGAGQRSTHNTPMGTTGTPGGGGAGMAQGSTAGSTAATTAGSVGASSSASGSMNSGASTANTGSGASMASGSGTGGTHHAAKKSKKRVAKADRN